MGDRARDQPPLTSAQAMRVVSVNVGCPRAVRWRGREITTAIFKEPAHGRLPLRRVNLDGDRQADLTVHGDAAKAVYAQPLEHYAFWREELEEDVTLGAFGENPTVEGRPLEDAVAVGDRFRVGTAELVVTQPRLPCYKLGIRFGRKEMVKRFLASGRTGYYLAVGDRGRRRSRRPGSDRRSAPGADRDSRDHPPVREQSKRRLEHRATRRSPGRMAALLRKAARHIDAHPSVTQTKERNKNEHAR
jgi:MOSC domain-containing protein YiiM